VWGKKATYGLTLIAVVALLGTALVYYGGNWWLLAPVLVVGTVVGQLLVTVVRPLDRRPRFFRNFP